MRLMLFEDASTALYNIQQKIEKSKQLIDKDFDEITDPDTIEALLDPKSSKVNPVGTNEKVVKKQYLMKLFGNKFSDIIETYSLIDQSLDTLGVDINNNLFLYYIKQLVDNSIEPRKNFASLVLSFIKSKKIGKTDIDSWLNTKSLYERDPKDTQYKIETLLFLKKQNGSKEYNLRIDEGSGKYRYLTDKDLYDGSNVRAADEIRNILQQAQQAGQAESDAKTNVKTNEEELTKNQAKIVKDVTAQIIEKNPKANIYDLTNIVRNLIVDEDDESTLLKKASEYLKKKGSASNKEVTKSESTDEISKRLYNGLVAAGYDETKVDTLLKSNKSFAEQIGQVATVLDRM